MTQALAQLGPDQFADGYALLKKFVELSELDHSEMLNRWSMNLTTDKAAVITPDIARRFNTDKTTDYQC